MQYFKDINFHLLLYTIKTVDVRELRISLMTVNVQHVLNADLEILLLTDDGNFSKLQTQND